MTCKSFLYSILILSCVILLQQKQTLSQEKLKITHGPYLVDPGENSITIIWFTNKESHSWVEYCGENHFGVFPNWGGYPLVAKKSNHGLMDANTKMHTIRITGLKAGTKYRYRIVSNEILQYDPYEVIFGDSVVGEICEFETLNVKKDEFSFGVVADLHERAWILDTLLQNTSPDSLDLMFLNGDILNWIGDENRIFQGFLDVSVNHFAKEKPFIFIRGNHETRGPNARKLFSYFPHSSGNFYYAFSHGNVRFVIMDAGEDKPDTHPVYAGLVDFDQYRTKQAEWLQKEVQSDEFKNAKYRIVLFHIPPFSESKKHGGDDITLKWGPILNGANIDIVISGHTHRSAMIESSEGRNNCPVLVIGKDMILKTDVSDESLSLTLKDLTGKQIDEYILGKK